MKRSGLQALYASTIFLGAFLLFLLEPLYAKLILPWFGGSASVWTLCLVFFQSALLLGYAYADLITRKFTPRHCSILHAGLLFACLWLIPITPDPSWRPLPGSDPARLLLGLLATQIGLPFVLISATSPLVQSWYARSFPGREPYILFALSNAASLLALLAFPFLMEPGLSASWQVGLWSWAFILFVLLCSFAAWAGSGTGVKRGRKNPAGRAVPLGDKISWVGLSACGSMLLLSVTNHITQDVAAVPLLWVFPLALYLLSFVLVFSGPGFYPRKWAPALCAVVLVFLNYAFYDASFLSDFRAKIVLLGAGLFAACWFCHGELARLKPAPRQLTHYYLMISLGGALGAVLVGLLAPRFFAGVYEYPLSLMAVALAALLLFRRESPFTRTVWGIILVFLALVFVQNVRTLKKESLMMTRNFYAPLRVVKKDGERTGPYLALSNGVVVHGKQFLDPARAMEGTAYYSSRSGAALAVNFGKGPKRVGLVGLGVGTLAVYRKPGDVYRFYEINPQVIQAANTYFSFLSKSRAGIEMVEGDARLSLAAEPPQEFDVLAVDAFSGDAIPVHLLTREAFALYLRHLEPEGILAIHTSNLYLDLAPVVRLLADDLGYRAVRVKNAKDPDRLIDTTEWVLVTKNKGFLAEPVCRLPEAEIQVPPGLELWTDDHNSLFTVLAR